MFLQKYPILVLEKSYFKSLTVLRGLTAQRGGPEGRSPPAKNLVFMFMIF